MKRMKLDPAGEEDFTKRISLYALRIPTGIMSETVLWENVEVPDGATAATFLEPYEMPYTVHFSTDRATTLRIYLQPWPDRDFLFMEEHVFPGADSLIWTISHRANAIALEVVSTAKVFAEVRRWILL